jgi:shikimate dehydrogenase
VNDLETIYRLKDFDKSTRLIGVTGFSERELITVSALNAAFVHLKMAFRCLPLGIGNMKIFRKIMEGARFAGAVINVEHQASILDIQPELHGMARETQAADVVIRKNDAWHGMHSTCHAWMTALKNALKDRYVTENPLKNRFVLIAGRNAAAMIIAREVQRQGGNVILASNSKTAGLALAQKLGCRFALFEAIYTTMHDVLVVCDEEKDEKLGRPGIRASYLNPGMVVMDLTAGARPSALLQEAQTRGCTIVNPLDLLLQTLELQAKMLIGKTVPREVLQGAIPERLLEE